MNDWSLALDVMRFEIRRSLSVGRIAVWALLVAFPVAIVTTMTILARYGLREDYSIERVIEPIGVVLYFLVPEVICLLGLLLWATPVVSTEIEGQTWVYLTLRPGAERWYCSANI